MKGLKRKIWGWPDGLVWKITNRWTLKTRRKKYELFLSLIRPAPQDSILDVGVAPYTFRGTNFLEQWYPYPERIVGFSNGEPEKYGDFHKSFPEVRLVFGDAKELDFPDNHFDVVFSNAVVEHVGPGEEQKRFVGELVRVSKRAFITTPSYTFPVDFHSLIPFAHWLRPSLKNRVYRLLGRQEWTDINRLNLLKPEEFLALFPRREEVKLYRQKVIGLTGSLVAVAEKK